MELLSHLITTCQVFNGFILVMGAYGLSLVNQLLSNNSSPTDTTFLQMQGCTGGAIDCGLELEIRGLSSNSTQGHYIQLNANTLGKL